MPHTLRYDVVDNRVDITLDEGGTSSLWWATKNEWLGLLDVASSSRHCTAASTESRSTTRAASTSSWHVSEQVAGDPDTFAIDAMRRSRV